MLNMVDVNFLEYSSPLKHSLYDANKVPPRDAIGFKSRRCSMLKNGEHRRVL